MEILNRFEKCLKSKVNYKIPHSIFGNNYFRKIDIMPSKTNKIIPSRETKKIHKKFEKRGVICGSN